MACVASAHETISPHASRAMMLKQVARIAVPASLNSLLFFAGSTITMMFVGQTLGVVSMAQFSVGIVVYNICGYTLGVGLAAALDTLVSQAFGRNPQSPEIGESLQRALLVNVVVAAPIIGFFLLCEPLLIFVFGKEMGSGAAVVLRCSPLNFLVQTMGSVVSRTLCAQKQAHLPLYGTTLSTLLCPLFCFLLVHRGLCASVWAITLTNAVSFFFCVAMCVWHPSVIVRYAIWPSPNVLKVEPLKEHIRIGFFAMCAFCSEWWSNEILQVVAAQVGTREVAALNIFLSIITILFGIPTGLAQATSVLVGNSLGANQPSAAFEYFSLILWTLVCSLCFTLTGLYFFGRQYAALFTDDIQTLAIIGGVMNLIAGLHAFDATQSTLQGVFNGVGKQHQCFRIMIGTLWLVGLPAAVILSIVCHLGFAGIILGYGVGLMLETPLLIVQIRQWDWVQIAEAASRKEEVPAP